MHKVRIQQQYESKTASRWWQVSSEQDIKPFIQTADSVSEE
jgi:hypothetical protein